jgi:hypothetical protein
LAFTAVGALLFEAGLAAGLAVDLAMDLAAGFGAAFAGAFAIGLAGAFFSALRAGATLPRVGADDFDFAALFFDFATALAMTSINPREDKEIARLTPLWRHPCKRGGGGFDALHMEPLQQSETDQAVQNQPDRDDQIQKPRHDQNQYTRNERYDR